MTINKHYVCVNSFCNLNTTTTSHPHSTPYPSQNAQCWQHTPTIVTMSCTTLITTHINCHIMHHAQCWALCCQPPLLGNVTGLQTCTGWCHGWVWVQVWVGIFIPQKNPYPWCGCDGCDVSIMNVSLQSSLTITITNHTTIPSSMAMRQCSIAMTTKTTWQKGCAGLHMGDRQPEGGHKRCTHKIFFSFCVLTIKTAAWYKNLLCLCHSPQSWPPANRPHLADQCHLCHQTTGVHSLHLVCHSLTFQSFKVACQWQCQLTLALPLRGSLVIFRSIPSYGLEYPWVFCKPSTHTLKNLHLWMQVQVVTGAGAGYSGKPQGQGGVTCWFPNIGMVN